jgi:hypothetical protein
MSKKLPYPEQIAKGYSYGTIPDRRRIKSCSNPNAWYCNKVGKVITVHYFATFGCWDTNGRWLDYYDLSKPLKNSWIVKWVFLIKRFLKSFFIK